MKLFKTNNIDVVNYCRMQFNFDLPSVTIAQRSKKLRISIKWQWYTTFSSVSVCASAVIVCMWKGAKVAWHVHKCQKSACLRIGPRYCAKCKRIATSSGVEISRYLGVHISAAHSHKFSCSTCDVKKSFYRSFTCIFGKIGRIASESVIVELLKRKCLPSSFYGLEVCPLNKSQISSLEYAIYSVFRDATKSSTVVNDWLLFLIVLLLTLFIEKNLSKLQHSDNTLLAMLCSNVHQLLTVLNV